MESLVIVGQEIKEYRKEIGLSQKELSQICGVERAQLSRIESGEIQGVTFATIEKILNSLGRTLETTELEITETFDIHPFVKWAGGKTQLLDVISEHLPNKFNRYFEPFVGGGALLFKLQPLSFCINDTNSELIGAFKCFQNDELFDELKKLLDEHEEKHSEEYYYEVRDMDKYELFNALPITDHAARMIYLNKACFNGLYRVNSKGYFNVPFGKKKIVKCYDRENFENLRKFFKKRKSVITSVDFEEAVKSAKVGDFVYFDPPYDTWEDKDSFTSYSKDSFGKDEQKRLAKVFKELSNKGVYCMLSNHNTKFIRELYSDFHINVVNAKRMINSKGDARGEVEEVLITNYE